MSNEKLSIAEKYRYLMDKINECEKEISTLQLTCPHERAKVVFKADTGNWSTSDDSYSVDVSCPECGYRASFDSISNQEEYNFWKCNELHI